MTHASNVLGTILPVDECFAVAREYGVITVLDAAQSAGVLPFTMGDCCDVIAFTGHKGLGGLAGTGGFVLGKEAAAKMQPWLCGGTGSASDSLDMPPFLPDKFEAGTQNTIGILSLAASVEELLHIGIAKIREHENALTARFIAGVRAIQSEGSGGKKQIKLCGTGEATRSVALVSIVVEHTDAGDLSRHLFEKHGIVTRSGLHCSPLSHKTAGTYPEGTVRFSFGRGTTESDIDTILEALQKI
jgi:selenocysteine lyase/cysteine desulfurase